MSRQALWDEQLTAIAPGLVVTIVACIAADRCPKILAVAAPLCVVPAIFLTIDGQLKQGTFGWAKVLLVVSCSTTPALCISEPRFRFRAARLRVKQRIGLCVSVILGLDMLWTLSMPMDNMLAKALAVCNLLLVAVLVVRASALLRRSEPLVDRLADDAWLICSLTPTSWVLAYVVWNAVFCWSFWGLSRIAHVLYCLAFMVVMHKRDVQHGTDTHVGYYFCYARAVTLGPYLVQRLHRPLWAPPGPDFALPEDDYWFLLFVMYCTAIFVAVILGLSLRDLWKACASGHGEASEQAASPEAGKQVVGQETSKIPCSAPSPVETVSV